MKKIIEKLKYLFLLIIHEPLFFGTLPFKLDKKEWCFRKSDEDINPSFPHLHSIDNRYKMNIYTGDIYFGKRKAPFSSISDEEHKMLWSDSKFLKDVKEMRKNYIYGEEKLPTIPYSYEDYKRNSYFE